MRSIDLRGDMHARRMLPAMLMASTMLTGVTVARAADAPPASATRLGEVIVTAQKRSENLQKVPVSVQVIGTTKIDQLQIKSFDDYAKFLPSVSYQTSGPGLANVYIRGIASGENSNHSGPQPSVGIYLDEEPITTIGGALDMHVYDVARVEELSGPQGTLYGASSEAGTIRIITNKPDPNKFSAGYDLTGTQLDPGGSGYDAEGYVNIPLTSKMAIRLVGWSELDGGYINNIAGTDPAAGILNGVRTYPTASFLAGMPITHSNAAFVKKDYNTVQTNGGRGALKVDLTDSWTATASLMGQDTESKGFPGYDRNIGYLDVVHMLPESQDDKWYQAALTVEGKIANFDVTYAGAYMDRRINSQSDYSDYSYFYDSVFGSTVYDNGGHTIDPSQAILGEDHFTKESHELRVASPKDYRLRFVGGLFYQRQFHFIQQRYFIKNLADTLSVDGWPNTIWLTKEYRVDRDMAAFGEATFDITDKLSGTAGLREYKVDNSLAGFAGLQSYESPASPHFCSAVILVPATPCTNVNADVKETGNTYKLNLTYQIDPDHMIYATQSTGFRPGGVNRAVNQQPYKADYLTNDEIGWKTSWFGNSLRWNGDVYSERWSGIQFSTILPSSNGLTVIFNAGDAEVRGIESDLSWRATEHLSLTAAGAFTDAHLITNYCLDTTAPCITPDAPKGSQLPVTPKYKANMTARYTFMVADMDAHVQGAVLYQSANWPALVAADRAILGPIAGYTTADFAAGVEKNNWTLEFAVQNMFNTHGINDLGTGCATQVCSAEVYATPIRPRLFSLKFGLKF